MSKSKKNKTQEAEKTLLLKLQEGKEAGEKEGYISSEDIHSFINKIKL